MADSPIRLVVLSDDFGMCEAVNEGITQAFTQGLLTDANLMAPCPAFHQAAQLAKPLRFPWACMPLTPPNGITCAGGH